MTALKRPDKRATGVQTPSPPTHLRPRVTDWSLAVGVGVGAATGLISLISGVLSNGLSSRCMASRACGWPSCSGTKSGVSGPASYTQIAGTVARCWARWRCWQWD